MFKVVEAPIAAGRVFHSRGAALAKALSPKVCNPLRGTVSSSESLDRSGRAGRYQDSRSTRSLSNKRLNGAMVGVARRLLASFL